MLQCGKSAKNLVMVCRPRLARRERSRFPAFGPVRGWTKRFLLGLALAAALVQPGTAFAKVMLTFHSFNGSLFGRYPHTFISMDGTLDATGQKIHENYGYSTSSGAVDVLTHDTTPGEIVTEKEKYVDKTNRHFTVPISDKEYREIRGLVSEWAKEPYSLSHHNCVHFVAAVARDVGLKADVPDDYAKRPKRWLNYVASINPQLHAAQIK